MEGVARDSFYIQISVIRHPQRPLQQVKKKQSHYRPGQAVRVPGG
jgi:hypothetical protein